MDPIRSLAFGLSEGLLQAALGTGVSLTRCGIDSLPKPTFTSAVEIRSGTHRESRCINELLGKGTKTESSRKNEANGSRSLKSRTVSAIHCDVQLGRVSEIPFSFDQLHQFSCLVHICRFSSRNVA